MPPSPRPIIIVTGANNGVGFGISHRLLSQLSRQEPASDEVDLNCDGLTLILACRSEQRAEVARTKLFGIMDELVRRAKLSPGYDGHAESFQRNLSIVVHTVDLADIQSVFHFADEITQTYPYVSHLICNAGIARFAKMNWPLACYYLLTDWIGAVTSPKFYLQHVGEVSQDGLGLVWQSNVFGHYVLFRALEPMLAKYTGTGGARVVWISSHEASSESYDPKDWQLTKCERSYECSKYQMNMISLYLDKEAIRCQQAGSPAARHFIAYPGVAGTNIASALIGKFLSQCMLLSFYIARLLGSPNHPIDVFKAAISAVYLSIVRITCLPSSSVDANVAIPKETEASTAYTSKADRWGREYVGIVKLVHCQGEESQTKELLGSCDRLLKAFCDIQGRVSPSS